MDNIKDFTGSKKQVQFRVDHDVFEGVEDLPGELAIEFANVADKLATDTISPNERIEIMRQMFRLILKPDSADRFIARMRDPEYPIGGERLKEIIPWLFEQYAERPTIPDGDSSTSSDDPELGMKLLANVQDAVSISDESTSPPSSMSPITGSRSG